MSFDVIDFFFKSKKSFYVLIDGRASTTVAYKVFFGNRVIINKNLGFVETKEINKDSILLSLNNKKNFFSRKRHKNFV